MLQNDRFTERGIAFGRSDTGASQFAVMEFLGYGTIFFPPSANRAHVVSRWSDDAEIGSIFRVEKIAAGILGHALDFEAQQAEIFHHLRNASRDKAEVFAANEHVRDTFQGGKFLHRFFQPEIVL